MQILACACGGSLELLVMTLAGVSSLIVICLDRVGIMFKKSKHNKNSCADKTDER
jgi:hypothetical protein